MGRRYLGGLFSVEGGIGHGEEPEVEEGAGEKAADHDCGERALDFGAGLHGEGHRDEAHHG
jgi:hypothetical protein